MHTKSPKNDITVSAESLEPPSWLDRYYLFIHDILLSLAVTGAEVSVVLCDDAHIQKLNATYRSRDEATDVLSFVADEGEKLPLPTALSMQPLGDVVISLPYVRRQAEEFSVPFEEEVRRVTIHGILHLLGHDHTSNDFEQEPMLQHQEVILQNHKEKLF